MDRKVLVTYASKYGATREIAERIDTVLRQAGLESEVYPVSEVRDLSLYGVVILGSAIYIGQWRKESVAFLKTHEKTLAGIPVWLFSSGPSGEGDPVKLVDGKRLPTNLQAIVNRIHPRDVAVFHGNIDLNKVNPIEKWAVKSLVKKPFGDFRNWDSIDNWSAQIATTLMNSDSGIV